MERRYLSLLAWLACAAPALGQSNGDGGIDLLLAALGDIQALGHTGVFPGGINGCAVETTACNVGTKEIDWQDVGLEGLLLSTQTFSRKPGNGPYRASFDLSDGLLLRVGNTISSCP